MSLDIGTGRGEVDPSAPGFLDDPYAAYVGARRHAPVQRHDNGVYMLFRYDDVRAALADRKLSSSERYALDAPRNMRIKAAGASDTYLLRPAVAKLDPPEHTPLRKLLARPFTPRQIARWTERAEQIVADLFEERAVADEIDIVAELAHPLPCRLVCEMFGIPLPEDMRRIFEWTYKGQQLLDPFLTLDELAEYTAAQREFTAHLEGVISWKRDHPADDVLTALISAGEAGDVIGPDQVAATVQTLMIAGFDTTVNQIGLSVLTLMRHRDQWDRLVREPSLVGAAVEETLRYEPTAQFMIRTVPEDYEIRGAVIPKGNHIIPWLGSANRDPEKFGDTADRFDITRANAKEHLAFGVGHHVCLGAYLARLEVGAVLQALVTRAPNTTVSGEPVWRNTAFMRGLAELRLRLT